MKSLNFYSRLKLKDLDLIVEEFKSNFDQQLIDLFTDDELKLLEPKIDSIAALYVQPMLEELSFDDFYFHPHNETKLRDFFDQCQSSIVFENIPFLETNPFQVTYFLEFLNKIDEALVDRGGVSHLAFKDEFIHELESFKGIDSLLQKNGTIVKKEKSSLSMDPIDFLMRDVYTEINRTKHLNLNVDDLPLKVQKIFQIAQNEVLDADSLLRKSGLSPKDFDDGLEKLKFWLRKMI
jgi:hypothetical protein